MEAIKEKRKGVKMKVFRQWKTKENLTSIKGGTVLDEIPRMNLNSRTSEALGIMCRNSPNARFVVCEHNDSQVILRVGRDVIPYSIGVGHKVKH